MTRILIQEAASHRIDEIYQYSLKQWGMTKAETYITCLFEAFEKRDTHKIHSRPVPADFEGEGFFFKYKKHNVYWKHLSSGEIGIVTLLHERMHQIERLHLKDDFGH